MSTSTTSQTPHSQEDSQRTFLDRLRPTGGQDLVSKRNHPARRALRFVRTFLPWGLLMGLVIWAWLNPDVLNIILVALGFAFRLLFAIVFIVIQFVALFWFISQTKVEVIRPGDPKSITFEDYRGQPHLLRMVKQWITLMSDRTKFQEMGGNFINGLLLYGPPGTGKTLLAKAMSGEAGVAFISIEGSGFRGMFFGMDVLRMIRFISRARKLAREYGACIAFIDEIDAVGMSRGAVMGGQNMPAHAGGSPPTLPMMAGGAMGMGGGSGALTRLLYEMDGVEERTRWEKLRARIYRLLGKPIPPRDWHVLFMGSTNRPDVIDPALTRPGRFDRLIEVNKPDRGGRRDIIQYYLDKIKHDDSVDVEAIVADTSNYTPAQVMSAITKDAVRLALFDDRNRVSQRDIDLAFQEQAMGLENPIEEMEEDQRCQVAYHEAGHAVAVHYLVPEQRIVRTTIIRRSGALGYVHSALNFEMYTYPLSWFVRRIMVSLAGDVATQVFLGEPWVGTGGDYRTVRLLLRGLAMSGYFGPPVDEPTQIYQEEMKRFWRDAAAKTERLLRVHEAEVRAIAENLLEKGDMSGREVVEIITRTARENGLLEPETPAAASVTPDEPGANGADEQEQPEGSLDSLPEGEPAAD
jgi:cell division protease FtsH